MVVAPGQPPPPAAARNSQLPLILTAVVGVLAGGLIMFAFVNARANASAVTIEPAAAVPPSANPVVESAPPPAWTGARQARRASDGSNTIVFELAATHDIPVWMSRVRPQLVVRCLSRATEAFVVLGTAISFEQDADRRTVNVQWDDEPATVQRWDVSEGRQELFAPDGVAFVRRMAQARHLRFGFTPFNAPPVAADFAVRGFDQLAGFVAGTCGWSLDQRVAKAG